MPLDFLAAWHAWKQDPQRPRMLHHVAVQPEPAAPDDLLHAAADRPELQELARQLAAQWYGLTPGVHRLAFEGGRVLLTLGIGAAADQMERGATQAFAPQRCLVVGAGLAGAAVASSFALRGWQVEVLDAEHAPAAGASALPAGLMAPHQSMDDNPLSRLTRSGIRITLQEAQERLLAGTDWALSGSLERRSDDKRALPALGPSLDPWSRTASTAQAACVSGSGWWHEKAAWVRPAALVRAWLATAGVEFRGDCVVRSLSFTQGQWTAHGEHGIALASAPLIVLAAAHACAGLLGDRIATHPVRGQVSWSLVREDAPAFPAAPVNGNGHFLPRIPLAEGQAWLTGSTYGRGDEDTTARAEDHLANLERLRDLVPAAAGTMEREIANGSVRAWTGVRCASTDRRPLVGELEPGLWVSTAMGSRGLSFAKLCAELIAARVHSEPWPLERRLAAALDLTRQRG
jgi:tRNA 5-methylaminomethyl-2-thiouridine biosynthesis bifunctional protein